MRKFIYIPLLLLLLFAGTVSGQNTMASPVDIGSKSSSFTYTDTQNTSNYTNNYGRSTNDVFYKFTITTEMAIEISHCGSAVADTYIYLLDAFGTLIEYNDNNTRGGCATTTQALLRLPMLDAGTYYVVSEGYSQNGNITTKIEGTASVTRTEFDLGTKSSSFTYTDTQNTSGYTNNYGRSTNDVFYKFTITSAMDVVISHCGSVLADTYVYLLDASETQIAYNDNYSGEGACTTTTQSYLKMTNLAAGTYYVVSEGYSQNGSITTKIEGTPRRTEIDLGTKSNSFTYTNTQNTSALGNAYVGQSTNDVFYKFTITSAMDIIISHCGSVLADTYVHLLNTSGTRIAYNDNYSGIGACTTTTQSYLKMANLAAGTYYVVSEGNSQNGSITTKIEGVILDSSIGSSNQNYIHSRIYTAADGSKYLDQLQYFDGLGRPLQTVQLNITPSTADLVSYQEYDGFGRENRSWLPVVASGNNGAFMTLSDYKTKAMSTYNSTTYNATADSVAYSRPVYEASPLNRVLEQYGPGADWQKNSKSLKTRTLSNKAKTGTTITLADSLICAKYISSDTKTLISITRSENYPEGELYVTRQKDEDGNTSYEFKDKQGKVILTRQINGNTLLDTYYIYDSFGNLRVVLPPIVAETATSGTWSDATVAWQQYAYLYKYDNRNRCIAKKLPGCEWIYYVYDKADRIIYTQDGEQYNKSPKEWTFTIPDVFGRVVLTGICKDTISVSNKVVKGVYASTGSYKRYNILVDGVAKNFTNTPSILSVNFYDNYDFRGMAEIPSSGTEYTIESSYGTQYTGGYKGLLTGALTAQMKSDGSVDPVYLYSVMYYDNRGRIIQTKSNNHLTGGIEKEYIAYNFTGQPTQKKHVHSATGKNTQTEVYAYTYDHAGRLLKTTHQLTDGTTVKGLVTLAENSYDELGRLKTNKKGGQANLNTTYTYNIRSWTKSITSPLFNQTLYYNDSYGGSTKQYNGNISAMSWQVQGESYKRGYAFAYDNLSRITSSNYLKDGVIQTYNSSTATNPVYQTIYTYDKHGNIKTLQSYGKITSSTYGLIDNLTYDYTGTGNQLNKVTDAVANFPYAESADFKNYGGSGAMYTYNKNGAMATDSHKGILGIKYNSLNLPYELLIKNTEVSGKVYYTYSALGAKLKTKHLKAKNLGYIPVTGTAGDTNLDVIKTTDYAGNLVYENDSLKKVLVDGGYLEVTKVNGVNQYRYNFYQTDHLGNNRVVANASGTAIQKNHYYPFGMAFAEGTTAEQGKQPYKYNGKELDQMHGLNLYDYSARYYESAIGRFTTVDPLAEFHYNNSPYAYVLNNPLKYIDPTGCDTIYAYRNGTEYDRVEGGDNITIYGPSEDIGVSPEEDGTSYWFGFAVSALGESYGISKPFWNNLDKYGKQRFSYELHKAIRQSDFGLKFIKKQGVKVRDVNAVFKRIGSGVNKGAKVLPVLGAGIIVLDVVANNQVKASNILDGVMMGLSFIPGIGSTIGVAYLVTDLAVKLISDKSIGDHLDNVVGTPIIDEVY